MKLLDRILVAVDFDSTLEAVIAQASYLASTFDAELVPVHAIEHIGEKQEAAERMSTLIRRLERDGLQVHQPILLHGRPFSIILSTANALDVNAILLGAPQKGLAGRLLDGVTANKVMHKAVMPVWVVHPGTPDVKHIVCAVDFSSASDQALQTGIHLSRNLQASLQVLHIAPKLNPDFASYDIQLDGMADGAQELDTTQRNDAVLHSTMNELDKYLNRFDLKDLTFTKSLHQGNVHEEIVTVAGDTRADLVIMGAFGQGSVLDQFLGNNADKVLRRASCSVLTVKHQDIFRILHQGVPAKDARQAAEERWVNASVRELASYIDEHYELGRELLKKGFLEDAIVEFRLCLDRDNLFSSAYEGIAEAYERMGKSRKAAQYMDLAKDHRRVLWQQKVQADVRRKNALFNPRAESTN